MTMQSSTVKSRIVNAAAIFFSQFGFHKTTMGDIARKIHKVKGALYYYFKSKEELYNEVLKQELTSVQLHLTEIVNSDGNPVEILERYAKTRLKLLNEANNYHETIKADFIERYGFVDDVRKDFEEFERSQLLTILSKGKEEGLLEFSDINSTVNLILMLLKSIEIPLFLQEEYKEYHRSIDELITMLSASLQRNINV
ncbi:MAG: TetR/AcrR family transcriptional regulator [Bacteroidales bacterium]|nr:TetR/AcrR family transcriptional regulator [Bacteroidales bacterium]